MSKKGVNIQNIQGTYATKKKKTNNLILKWGKGLNRHFSRKTFSSVQSLSHARLFAVPKSAAHQASLSFNMSHSFLNSCPLSQ